MNVLNEIQQKLIAPKGQLNKFGNYKYRSCEDILEAIKPLLGEAVLMLTDEIVLVGERYYVKATATLSPPTGNPVTAVAYAREALNKKGMDESQITGAASSYARKYALNGMFCIDDTKDADTTDPSGGNNSKPPDVSKSMADKFEKEVINGEPPEIPEGSMATVQSIYEFFTSKGKIDLDKFNKAVFAVRQKWPTTGKGAEVIIKKIHEEDFFINGAK